MRVLRHQYQMKRLSVVQLLKKLLQRGTLNVALTMPADNVIKARSGVSVLLI